MGELVSLDYISTCGLIGNILGFWKALVQGFTCVKDLSFVSPLFLHCTVGFIYQDMI